MQTRVTKGVAVLTALAFCSALWGQPTDRNPAERPARGAERPQAGQRIQPTKADIPYGTHERNIIDFYQAKSDRPVPLVLFIHGGGFRGGERPANPSLRGGAPAILYLP